MSLKNQSNQKRYVFPARAVLALQADADGNVGKTFSLHWRQFIEAANKKAPIDEETIYALELFSQIQFRLSAEVWGNFEGLLARAENRSGQSGASVFLDGTPAYEADAELYFDALYASKNTSSQTPAQTLRMIAKYLFAVRNLPVDRAFRFATDSNYGVIPPQPHHELHLKALDKIWVHWNAWRDAEMAAEQQRDAEKASDQVEYAQVPESPIQPAEPLESPQSMGYLFPPRAVIVKGDEASNPPRKRFRLFWGQFIRHAAKKAPIDPKTAYALDLFNQIEFNVSQEKFHRLENMLSTAVSLSENPLFTNPDAIIWACESHAINYFDEIYSPENHSSQVHPTTLRMIAKYLFAVRNLPVERALPFVESMASFKKTMLKFQENKDAVSASLHNQVYHAIVKHWQAWRDAEKASDQVEYAQVPESPIQPAEPLEAPDMDVLMRRAFAAFEEGKPLAEAGMVVCDAFGLREVYEEQLKDPKNRAILAIGETILRALQTVLRPPTTPEKPFVMSTPVVPPTQAPSNSMSDVVKGMIEKQQQREAAKKAEIDAAYRQRDEQIRQAKADAECQDALERINRGYAKNKEEGAWLPLVGNATRGANMAQILADLKAKADEQHELSQKIREHFSDKGENFVAQLRRHIVYDGSKSN